jgi:hypothetical protein
MTPKRKAQELVENFENALTIKDCALIAVDEIIKAIGFDWMEVKNLDRQYAYWEQVKQEIEKL